MKTRKGDMAGADYQQDEYFASRKRGVNLGVTSHIKKRHNTTE